MTDIDPQFRPQNEDHRKCLAKIERRDDQVWALKQKLKFAQFNNHKLRIQQEGLVKQISDGKNEVQEIDAGMHATLLEW